MVFAAKTAKVWRYFDQLPPVEQAAECKICHKKIKATNSSTTGMIRHLRSCHAEEYKCLQEARQSSLIQKQEEKAKALLLDQQKHCGAIAGGGGIANGGVHHLSSPKQPRERPPLSLTATAPQLKRKLENASLNLLTTDEIANASPVQQQQQHQQPIRKRQSRDYYWPDDHPFAKKITTQLGLMMIVDKETSSIVEREGLRHLIRAMAPKYRIPTAEKFEKTILPELIGQLKSDISRIHQLAINNDAMDTTDCALNEPEPSPSSTTDCHSDEAASEDTVSTGVADEINENTNAYRALTDYMNGSALTMQQMLMKSILNAQDISHSFNCGSLQLKNETPDGSASEATGGIWQKTSVKVSEEQQRRLDEFYAFIGDNVFNKSLTTPLVLACESIHSFFSDSSDPMRQTRLSAFGALPSGDANDDDCASTDASGVIAALRFVHRRIDALRVYRMNIGIPALPKAFFSESEIGLMDDLIAHIECL